ncbi:sensor histidine kinase [Halalkalibacter nanhaiisediminis]|uniref:Histidine kinase n=1 Tax=Halalkalibacter nanhaiisediminis TaxID=688079 RepID=A0A562QJI5_9BACI|nr:PocR ligand-binding domain-containing protein [Halalkalibacter nanhaiisediminis]TWI56875.1 histidine kinase [Halalkalibacter nanhaiisediminis]
MREFVDIEKLQEIQNQFAEATGVGVIICDTDGVPLTKASNFTEFCHYIRSCSEGERRCILSDGRIGKIAAKSNRPTIHRCHSGLVDFAAPIILRETYLGAVLCGQVLMEDEEFSDLADMRMNLAELPLNQETLQSYYKKLEYKTRSRVEAIAELLFVTANYIVEMGDAYLTKMELSRNSEKLMKELQTRTALEKVLKETQLKVLQSQINPHFLFNTLNTISRIAYLENADQTQNVTYLLGNILRYSLRNIDQLVSLKEELEHVENYLYIQRTRYRDQISFTIEIDRHLEHVNVPIFTLQPIVENAIVHGFEPIGRPIHISLQVFSKAEKIIIHIIDNGAGLESDQELVLPIQTGKGHTTGIGLNNVNQRIKHYFGDEWGIKVLNRDKENGTLVQIMIPNHLA